LGWRGEPNLRAPAFAGALKCQVLRELKAKTWKGADKGRARFPVSRAAASRELRARDLQGLCYWDIINFMKIITQILSLEELTQMALATFGNLVKAVVDVDRELLAVDAELHSDLEALLLEDGSKQRSLWGINLYPEMQGEDFIEFDSLINIRPSQGNRSRGIDEEGMRKKIAAVVAKRIKR